MFELDSVNIAQSILSLNSDCMKHQDGFAGFSRWFVSADQESFFPLYATSS